MGAFKYEGFDRSGNKVNGSIEAKDLREAKILLRRQGRYFPLREWFWI